MAAQPSHPSSPASTAGAALPQPDARKIRILKAICIILGVLIVAALATIVLTIVFRASRMADQPPAQSTPVLPQPPAAAGQGGVADRPSRAAAQSGGSGPAAQPLQPLVDVDLPPGTRVVQAAVSDGWLTLLTAPGDNAAPGEVVVVDLRNGRVLTRVRLRPGAAGAEGE
ncbi:hypothetical protein [Rhodoligotrophos defluvii]|uniref:hypothetical protein n=1 Tax=Rhodoligotrophos defluvii TaxID=2561934 RepID=UPI0010CA1669|nr:hypothetical protein [Rhodoligotrophos defluvii]